MKRIVSLLCLLSLSCTPIVESMLQSPKDGSTDQVGPDGPDIEPDRDAAPDQPSDGEDMIVDVPIVTVNTACNAMTLPTEFECYDKTNCGDGPPIDCGENCDDNNLVNGDGCDPACLFETRVCTWAQPILDPADIVVEGEFLYVSDDSGCFILRLPLGGGDATIFAGQPGLCEYTDGAPEEAKFNGPMGLEVLGSRLVVVDSRNSLIRTVDMADRHVETLAGGGEDPLEGPCDQVRFVMPMGIATDGENLYVADMGNHRVAMIQDPMGACSVHSLPSTGLEGPAAVAIHPLYPAHLYVADTTLNAIYRYDLPGGTPVKIAGNPGSAGSTDAIGSEATFDRPLGLDSNGVVLIVADSARHLLREIEIQTGPGSVCDECRVTTVAGQSSRSGCIDTEVSGHNATLSGPRCAAFGRGPEGIYRFFFCDPGCDAVRVVK
jgi:cysteine-rich repeat protein